VFAFQDTQGRVEIAFTDRHGGTSGGPYASLNLASRTDDSVEAVTDNLGLVADALADGRPLRRLVGVDQVHGADVHLVDESNLDDPQVRVGDALVTRLPQVALMVRVADCLPVLLADPAAGVVGAAHAGRQGLVAGVVPRTVDAMRDLGATRIRAWVGPHVCGRCYEVPDGLRTQVAATVPGTYAETSWGTPALDLGAGVAAQLAALGVRSLDVSRCTLEDDDLFSYRRQGERSGRLAGLVWVTS
jgi:YfiH family protein